MLPIEAKRQLAITIFAEVAPCSEVRNLSARCYIESALWSARRVHPLICKAECPYLQDATGQVDQYLSGQRVADITLKPANPRSCTASRDLVCDRLRESLITLHSIGMRTIDNLLKAAQADRNRQSPENTSCEGSAYAGRLVAHFEGVKGAVDFCMAFARQLGM
jgi:hypothetical protein